MMHIVRNVSKMAVIVPTGIGQNMTFWT